jgi:chloramphenicol-sensitive protein RarD
MSPTQLGYWSVIASYVCWGFMPIYTREFTDVSMLEFFVHRIVWSAVILVFIMLIQGKFFELLKHLTLKTIGFYAISAILVAANWYIFVWGILRGDITEASLGYFINPLISVVLGLVILREKLRNIQVVAIIFVILGVAVLGFAYGKFPWLALALGGSFGLYGLVRKLGTLRAVEGLTLEMILLLPFVLILFYYLHAQDQLIFGTQGWLIDLKLMTIGIITAVPMLIFIFGVQRISMTSLGFIQYLGPTLQFLSGVFIFHEIIDQHRFLGYATVWVGLIIFAVEGLYSAKKNQSKPAEPVMMD